MDFTLSREQLMAQQLFRDFAQNEVKPIAAEVDEEEKFPEAWVVAGQVFYRALCFFKPLIPEFMLLVERNGEGKNFSDLLNAKIEGTKDYKIHLLFDIFKGIVAKKADLHIKKHLCSMYF